MRADRHTDRDTRSSQYFAPLLGDEDEVMKNVQIIGLQSSPTRWTIFRQYITIRPTAL